MGFAAGKLRHRIELQEQVEAQDSETGDLEVTWSHVAYLWAAIEPISGREFVSANAVQSAVVARITIRHRSGVVAKMRALHNGKVYNIEAVLPDKDSGLEYLTLPVSEGVNNG